MVAAGLLAAGAALLLIGPAAAEAGASSPGSGLGGVVLVTLLVGLGYVATNLIVHRLERRFFIISGVAYLALGFLLRLGGIITEDNVNNFTPVISLGIGSIGLSVGLQAHRHRTPRLTWESVRGAGWTGTLTTLFVTAAFVAWYWVEFGLPSLSNSDALAHALAAALVLAAAAVVSASDLIVSVIASYAPREGPQARLGFLGRYLINTAWLSELVGIIAFGAVFCVVRRGELLWTMREPTSVEWFVINIAVGVLLGALFSLFLGREQNEDRLFVALLGIVVFASGLASYLNLSPIFVNFVIGVLLGQREGTGRILRAKFQSIEKPIYVVLFIFAGAAWVVPGLSGWVLASAYIVMRLLGRQVGGWVTRRYSDHPSEHVNGEGWALMTQGELVAAMALNYHQVFADHQHGLSMGLSAAVFNCLIISLVINELFAPRQVRDVLVEAGELDLSAGSAASFDPHAVVTLDDRARPRRKPYDLELPEQGGLTEAMLADALADASAREVTERIEDLGVELSPHAPVAIELDEVGEPDASEAPEAPEGDSAAPDQAETETFAELFVETDGNETQTSIDEEIDAPEYDLPLDADDDEPLLTAGPARPSSSVLVTVDADALPEGPEAPGLDAAPGSAPAAPTVSSTTSGVAVARIDLGPDELADASALSPATSPSSSEPAVVAVARPEATRTPFSLQLPTLSGVAPPDRPRTPPPPAPSTFADETRDAPVSDAPASDAPDSADEIAAAARRHVDDAPEEDA